eukprot:TRINITY_DN8529_c0_g1_i1.p1 TRINITY_DN8529_c0_g1~~TRINITY_DN8529_c0_g1_i1.p1  ORF type:complete len:396 (+),score=78.90 TRINITY_DN8529_c0_g1_i1:28-1188(+)
MADLMETDSNDDIRVVFHYESLSKMGFNSKDYCNMERLTQAESTGAASADFRHLAADLIAACGPSCRPVSTSESLFEAELAAQLAVLEFPLLGEKVYLSTMEGRHDLIDFLISEVQVYRIMQARREDNDGMDVDGETRQPPDYIMSKKPSKVISNRQRLINACRTLDIPYVADDAACLANILKKVDEIRANLPVDYEGKRIWTTPLNADETKMANEINEAFQDEYKARREMMLKRLDVTLQTLLWSEKAKLHYDEMMDIIEKHKPDILDSGAPFHTLLDVFAAQDDLLAVQKTSHHSSVAGSKLSGVLVTDVVDRGGRFGEKRKAKDMPTFAARSDSAQKHSSSGDASKSTSTNSAPKGQRGDGGGRGRGGGRGGGHGNKRGGKKT